jgi:cyclase
LLKDFGLVKTTKFKNPTYVGDPINAVKIFNDKYADELIFLDIAATETGRGPDFDKIKEIASECFMPLSYGGGVRTLEHVRKILNIGCEKVIINTFALENPDFLVQASRIFGSQSIVAAMDVKKTLFGKHEVFSMRGRRNTGKTAVEYAKTVESLGAGEVFVNAIDRDGVMAGFDIELIKAVSFAVGIPVIACGGAGTLADLQRAVKEGGASAVAAGSMFVFHGPHRAVLINYPEEDVLSRLFL